MKRTEYLFSKRKHLFLLILLIVLAGSAAVSHYRFSRTDIRVFPDTNRYLHQSSSPALSPEILASREGAPVYLLVLKACGQNLSTVAGFQFFLSIAAWGFLSFCCAYAFDSIPAKFTGFILVQALMLSQAVEAWLNVGLTESTSISLLAAVVGSWLLFSRRPRPATTVIVIFVTAVWAFTRDTNAYLTLGVVPFLLAVMALRKRWNVRLVVLSAAFFLIFTAMHYSANKGGRFLFPFYNIIGRRVLEDESTTQWFVSRGMPFNDDIEARAGRWATDYGDEIFHEERYEAFRQWAREEGKSLYFQWLLTRPARTVLESLGYFPEALVAGPAGYAPENYQPLISLPYSPGIGSAVLGSFLAGLLATVSLRRRTPAGIIALFMLALLIPHHVLIWHGDAMEITRHSVQVAIQAKIALVLLCGCALDTVFRGRNID